MTAIQVMQLAKLHISAAMIAAGTSSLQQHASRLQDTTAVHCMKHVPVLAYFSSFSSSSLQRHDTSNAATGCQQISKGTIYVGHAACNCKQQLHTQ